MCGIVFSCFSPDSCINVREIARTLLVAVENRGPQATGIAWLDPQDNSIDGFNAAETATRFVADKGFRRFDDTARTFIGHTRFATKGSIDNPLNNHPVYAWTPEGQMIAAVHNGGVWNDDETFAAHRLPRYGQVDSEIIPAMIAQYGSTAGWVSSIFGELEGGIATAWLDERQPGVLHCVRAADSPMMVMTLDVDLPTGPVKGVVGASTVSALTKVLDLLRIDWQTPGVTQYEIGEGEFFTVKDGVWDTMVVPFVLPDLFTSWGGNWRSKNKATQGNYGRSTTTTTVKDGVRTTVTTPVSRDEALDGYERFYNPETGTAYYVATGHGAAVLEDDVQPADAEWWEKQRTMQDLIQLGNRMIVDDGYVLSPQDRVLLDVADSLDIDIEEALGLPSEALYGSDEVEVEDVTPVVTSADDASDEEIEERFQTAVRDLPTGDGSGVEAQVQASLAVARHIITGQGWPQGTGVSVPSGEEYEAAQTPS
jgi:hypothetical protein